MAFAVADRVKETSTTTGTGTLDLAGAEPGYQTFVAGIGNGNTTYYAIVNRATSEFEVGIGTVTDAATDTLSRTTVISSSNSDALVNFSAGTKDVICTLPSEKSFVIDNSSNTTITSNLAVTGGATFTANVSLGDSDRINLGASDDLQIYHNGTDSYILDTGAGDLYIGGSSNIYFTKGDGTGASAQFIADGASKLRYNNSTKFETTSTGVQTTGTVNVNGAYTLPTADGTANQVLQTDGLGAVSFATLSADITGVTAGSGLTGGGTSGDVTLNVGAGTGVTVNADDIAIGQDVATSATPTFAGAEFTSNVSLNDNDYLLLGTGDDLQIYHDGVSTSYIKASSDLVMQGTDDIVIRDATTTEEHIRCNANDSVQISYDGSVKLTTTSTGISVTGGAQFTSNVSLNDNDYILLGTGDDLQLYHDGSNSYVQDGGTGNLILAGSTSVRMRPTGSGEDMLIATANGSVDVYYDNSKKLETTSGGIAVTGAITATGDITAFYTSDETLKTNIANIENPMEKVAQLNGVSYNWTDEAQAKYDHLNGDKEVGVIAQQVEKVLPEMVGTRDDGTKAVRYERMCALLIECVKDLQNQVNELKKGN